MAVVPVEFVRSLAGPQILYILPVCSVLGCSPPIGESPAILNWLLGNSGNSVRPRCTRLSEAASASVTNPLESFGVHTQSRENV